MPAETATNTVHRLGHWLLAVLLIDGAGVLALSANAVLTGHAVWIALAVVAAAGWLLALSSVPAAARTVSNHDVRTARVRVSAGLVVTVLGAIAVLAFVRDAIAPGVGLLIAGVAVSAAYLILLHRLSADAR